MPEQRSGRSRRRFLTGVGAAGAAALAGCTNTGDTGGGGGGNNSSTGGGGGNGSSNASEGGNGGGGSSEMTVFHAGSLSPPFSRMEKRFENQHDVQVNREAKGSVGSTKKITEQGRKADVLGVSDFRLLRDMLLPKFGNWYSIFATNAMTLAYTEQSAGAGEIGPDNWWEILLRDDVSFAHADPAVDPNGYRSVMSMELGSVPFQGSKLYDRTTFESLKGKAKVPAATESELLGQLQAGKLDYAWEYQSAGATHDVQTVDLTPAIDLSKATQKYAEHYAKAEVQAGGQTFTGAPIAYGVTVPSVSESPEWGARWVQQTITKPGQTILRDTGFEPVEPAVVPKEAQNQVPKRVVKHAEAKSSLGPLQL